MAKVCYCTVAVRAGNKLGMFTVKIDTNDVYNFQNNRDSIRDIFQRALGQEMFDDSQAHITHFAYGRTEESAALKLKDLGVGTYFDDVRNFYRRDPKQDMVKIIQPMSKEIRVVQES